MSVLGREGKPDNPEKSFWRESKLKFSPFARNSLSRTLPKGIKLPLALLTLVQNVGEGGWGRKVSALTLNVNNYKTVLLKSTKLDDFSLNLFGNIFLCDRF